MRNNKFFQATFILMIGGLITKVLGFVIKIIFARTVGDTGVSLYAIIAPTYSLLITIATLGLPIAISKLVAENKKTSQRIVFSIVPVMLALNILLILLIVFLAPFMAKYLLKQETTTALLIALSLTLPFITLSSILKGYFYGKQRMMPHTVSNVMEQIIRLILIAFILPKLLAVGVIEAVMGMILLNIISETASIIVFLFYLPKKFKIRRNEIKPDMETIKDVFSLSLPTVSSRIIGNIGYFFEPIILTNILIFVGYSSNFIMLEYGYFNAYALQTLLLPSFFIMALSSSLIPEISKFAGQNNYKMVKRRFNQAIKLSLIIGLIFSFLIYFFADNLLMALYKTTKGVNYIKILVPFFVLYYIEGPLISTLQALGKANITMKVTFWGIIIKLVATAALSLFHIGLYGLVIAEIINIIFIVSINYFYIKKLI